jgi:two-component system, OmpR family, alkaline phosphatase synthesis response regulator PhoP
MAQDLILLVDDEANIVELARLYLERDGFQVQSVSDGLAALSAAASLHPALMVLDVMLPKLDGFEVCRKLRAEGNSIPILMVTARDDDIDKILGLELGADDYLTKPFNPRELVARVKAILRRTAHSQNEPAGEVIRIGDLMIEPGKREVSRQGKAIELRTQEFEVLLALAQHRGLVLSREQLLNLAWGYDFYGQTRTVDVHIAQLRRKLSGSKVQIETVTGIGYKLVGG